MLTITLTAQQTADWGTPAWKAAFLEGVQAALQMSPDAQLVVINDVNGAELLRAQKKWTVL